MIIKEVDEVETNDKFLKAGLHAEKQMAYYLQREFKDDKKVLVLNGIRLESDGDSAQMDMGWSLLKVKAFTALLKLMSMGSGIAWGQI